MLERPASTFGRATIEEDHEVINLPIRPDDKLALVYEVYLHGIAHSGCIPDERQLITRFQLEAFRPRLNRNVDRSIFSVLEGLLRSCHAVTLRAGMSAIQPIPLFPAGSSNAADGAGCARQADVCAGIGMSSGWDRRLTQIRYDVHEICTSR